MIQQLKHVTRSKRRKTCNMRQARETCNVCQARKNMQRVPKMTLLLLHFAGIFTLPRKQKPKNAESHRTRVCSHRGWRHINLSRCCNAGGIRISIYSQVREVTKSIAIIVTFFNDIRGPPGRGGGVHVPLFPCVPVFPKSIFFDFGVPCSLK